MRAMRSLAKLCPDPLHKIALACMVWLCGCASPPVPVVEPPAAVALEQPTAAVAAPRPASAFSWSHHMAAAASKLRDELSGAGVAVTQATDQRLWVSLPSETVFAPGRSAVKPPATAWLDRIALTLREQPRAEAQILGEPDPRSRDDAASRMLALDRAASARDWMVARGISAQRVSVAGRRTASQGPAEQPRLDIFIGERATPAR